MRWFCSDEDDDEDEEEDEEALQRRKAGRYSALRIHGVLDVVSEASDQQVHFFRLSTFPCVESNAESALISAHYVFRLIFSFTRNPRLLKTCSQSPRISSLYRV